MPIRTSFIQTLVTLSTLLTLTTPPAQAGSQKDYWNETNIGINNLKSMINVTNCYVNEQQFQACVASLRVLAEMARKNSVILSPEYSDQAKSCTPIEAFGPLTWCEMAPEAASQKQAKLKPAAAIAKYKADLLADDAAMQKTHAETPKAYERCMAFSQGRDPMGCFKRVPAVDFDSAVDRLWAEVKKQKPDALSLAAGQALNAFMNVAFDPHTDFRPLGLWKEVTSGASSFVGIGVSIGAKNNKVVVVALIEDGPAHVAGVRPGDVIEKIDSTAVVVTDADLEGVRKQLRGTEGSKVRLTLLRNGQAVEATLIRKPIVTKNVKTKVVEDRGRKIGYLRLNSFSEDACAPVKEGLISLKKQNIESLIFDLRGNGGGVIGQAACIAGLFVGKKVIVKVQAQGSPDMKELSSQEEKLFDLPMVTLLDAGSASASELVAGALQDHKRSWIAGARSFGKGSAQIVRNIEAFYNFFPWMQAMFQSATIPPGGKGVTNLLFGVTVERFFQPSGRTNQSVGIIPDISLDPFPGATEDDKVASREENMYTNALPPLGKPWVQPRPQEVADIERCMASTGQADTLYAQRKSQVIPPDYQVLKAQDLLTCVRP